jgi:hypothetical protein
VSASGKNVVWKYPLAGQRGGFEAPVGARVLRFGWDEQDGIAGWVCAWVLVDTTFGLPTERVRVELVQTGTDVSDLLTVGLVHRETVFSPSIAWHVFAMPDGPGPVVRG